MREEESSGGGTGPKRKKKGKKPGASGSYGKIAKTGVLWALGRRLSRHVIAVPAAAVMARLLSPDEFGIAAAATFFLTFASRITEFGLNAALVRLKQLRPEHQSSVFLVSLLFGSLTWLALTIGAPFIGGFFRSDAISSVVAVSAWSFLIMPWSAVPSALLQRNLRFKAQAFVEWTDALTGATVAIVLAWLGFSYWSLVYSHLAANVVTAVSNVLLARWTPSFRFSRQAIGELWEFGLGIQIKRIFEFASQNLDNLLVGRLIGITALGFYDKAFMTAQRLQQTLNLGPAVAFRIFAILQDDTARFRRAYQKVLLTVAVLGIPPLAVGIAVAPELFEVMYGSRWMHAVPAFQVLCVATMMKLTSTHATRANEAKGLIWRQVLQHGGYVLLIVAGVWIGSRWGITGVAVGVLTARFVLAVMIHNLLREALEARWREMLRPVVPGVLVGLVVAAAVLAVAHLLRQAAPGTPAFLVLAAQAAVAMLVWVPLVAYSPFAELRVVVRETIEDFAPRFLRWAPAVPAPAPDTNLTKVG